MRPTCAGCAFAFNPNTSIRTGRKGALVRLRGPLAARTERAASGADMPVGAHEQVYVIVP